MYSAYNPHKPCGDPPEIVPNGTVVVEGLWAGYSCFKGEKLVGPVNRTCDEKTAQWSPDKEVEAKCVRMMQEIKFE